HLARLPDQLVGAPAEHLGKARVAQEELALAREGDAHRQVGEQGLVLELRVARAPRVARRLLLDERALRDARVVHRALASPRSRPAAERTVKSSANPRNRATKRARCSASSVRSRSPIRTK